MAEPETYRDVIHRFYGGGPRGATAEEICRGEQRLGRPFPRVLREYYLLTAHREPFNHAQDRLLAPDAVFREAGAVVFYEENQRVNLWGILDANLDREDPPVHSAWNEKHLTWELDHDRLSDFFLTMAYWQAANGALPNLALGRANADLLTLLRRHWPEVGQPGERWGMRIFSRDGQVVCVLLGPDAECQLHAAGRTPADLRVIRRQLPVKWDLVETEED
jgi:hypothetical protein